MSGTTAGLDGAPMARGGVRGQSVERIDVLTLLDTYLDAYKSALQADENAGPHKDTDTDVDRAWEVVNTLGFALRSGFTAQTTRRERRAFISGYVRATRDARAGHIPCTRPEIRALAEERYPATDSRR